MKNLVDIPAPVNLTCSKVITINECERSSAPTASELTITSKYKNQRKHFCFCKTSFLQTKPAWMRI